MPFAERFFKRLLLEQVPQVQAQDMENRGH